MICERLVLPYPPATNRLWRTTHTGGASGKKGNYPSVEYRSFKYEVAMICTNAKLEPAPVGSLVCVKIDIYRPRKVGDLDGRLKGLLDALNGFAWVDDLQIVEIVMRRYDDKANPRSEVTVSSVDAAEWENSVEKRGEDSKP